MSVTSFPAGFSLLIGYGDEQCVMHNRFEKKFTVLSPLPLTGNGDGKSGLHNNNREKFLGLHKKRKRKEKREILLCRLSPSSPFPDREEEILYFLAKGESAYESTVY